ncbi:hypothetical protein [Streptomyces cinnamoneus]|uniref:hypothetical protein n=1 Tax=Streptomyces cinnamoneus TaxID=53446 RepID=UPI0015E44B1E|nr:hypothetical protein [Streptomyces cinnamoneus]
MGEWTWEYEGYDPAVERLREALHTLGNGYPVAMEDCTVCRLCKLADRLVTQTA